MGKYFGTDGVRGIANKELTPELAYRLGRCGGVVLAGKVKRAKVLIGRDTRISGEMLESALIAGLLSIGVNVVRLGIVTTPAVAFLTRTTDADAGVMISASHNPVGDNGIKFFGSDGFKLLDETELEIEQLMEMPRDSLPRPIGKDIGKVSSDFSAKNRYLNALQNTVTHSFSGIKVVLDCAHGAAYELAPQIFRSLGAEVIAYGVEPDGLNINKKVGSTYPQMLAQKVLEHNADLGLAFDGDADRLIAIDENGEETDGDYLLFICGRFLQAGGKLAKDTIVTTVMANMGFQKTAEQCGMHTVRTSVGDRYVMEEMIKKGYKLGGEQSGHIIFLDYSTTGDGILTGVQLMNILADSGNPLSELKKTVHKYPQVLINVRVTDKTLYSGNKRIAETVDQAEKELGNNGRILIRPSGTESLIRIMMEGPDLKELEQQVQLIAGVIREELGKK